MREAASTALVAILLTLLPAAAHAVLDLETLELEVAATTSNTGFTVTFTITGADIASASVTIPTTPAPTKISIPCTAPTTCTTTRNIADQNALDALIPPMATNYTVDLVGTEPTETISDTISYARPAVPPSPAITEPLNATIVAPGAITIRFAACGTCSADTEGTVRKNGSLFESKLDLPTNSMSWTPTMSFPANSDFTAEITHNNGSSVPLTTDGPGAGTEDVSYTFISRVTHSDTVAFTTGFAAPAGEFCIVVNDPDMTLFDVSACDDVAYVDAPALGVFDPSGMYTADAAGIPVEYSVQLGPKGKLTGVGGADLDDNGSFETPGELKGRLRGRNGSLKQRTRTRFRTGSSDTRFTLRLRETAELGSLNTPPLDLDWLVEQKTRGKAGGVKLKETTTYTRTVSGAATGWILVLSLSGSDVSGRVQLATGLSVTLAGKGTFDSASNVSDLKLKSQGAERGVRVRVKNLVVNDVQQLTSGDVRFRGFGQRANVLVP